MKSLTGELNSRFCQNDFIIKGIDTLCPTSVTFCKIDHIKPFANHYKIDMKEVKRELTVMEPTLHAYELEKECTMLLDFTVFGTF
jgi:hypothetical protein